MSWCSLLLLLYIFRVQQYSLLLHSGQCELHTSVVFAALCIFISVTIMNCSRFDEWMV